MSANAKSSAESLLDTSCVQAQADSTGRQVSSEAGNIPFKEFVALDPLSEAIKNERGDNLILGPAEPPEFGLARRLVAGEPPLHQVNLFNIVSAIHDHMFHENVLQNEACKLHNKLSDKFM